MNTPQANKTDFIKFNVSPEFKALAAKKAKAHGLTISELGRTLFGAFVLGVTHPQLDISPEFLSLADKAKKNYQQGLGITIHNQAELETFLDSL